MMRLAKGGVTWISTSVILTSILFCIMIYFPGQPRFFFLLPFLLFFILSCVLLVFFRDPDRSVGPGVVAVADGRIREITTLKDNEVGMCTKISTFMNIHNVHVNRVPLDGTITQVVHQPGAHIPAFQKESENNERVVILFETSMGVIKIIQIAGTVARRIVPYVKPGDVLQKGERLGLIRLGSRVDLYLPIKAIKQLIVTRDQKVIAGEDTLAELYD